MDNQNTINEIRSKIDIVELISEYVPLTKKGQYYWGVCPFHNDKNPSMSVDPKRQTFNCWSCHTSGNVFSFVSQIENLTFPETLKFLGNKVGIQIGYSNQQISKNEKFYKMYDLAEKFYQLHLNTQKGKEAKEYLEQRKITQEEIKEFGIGLAPLEKDKLIAYFNQLKYDINTMEEIGLSTQEHDTFINRIVFPLHDPQGRTVGFSGRIYNTDQKTSKYLNTKETNIFKKGHCLYNYYRCKEAVREKKYVILMEGFMDVIRASTIGVKNTIALMGTALTEEHISLIKKLSLNVYICLDGDEPGQNATISNGEALEKAGLNVVVVPLNNNDDPDTYILNNGKDKFYSLLENPINFSDFKIEHLKKGININSDIELTKYIHDVLQEVSKINDEIRREIILKKLASSNNLSYNTLEKKLNELLKSTSKAKENIIPKAKITTNQAKYQKACLGFLFSMITNTKTIQKFEEENVYFKDAIVRYLAAEIANYYHKYGDIVIADFYTYLNDKKELLALYEKVISFNEIEEIDEKVINDYLKVIEEENLRQEIIRLTELMKSEKDELEKAKIAERIRKLRIGE